MQVFTSVEDFANSLFGKVFYFSNENFFEDFKELYLNNPYENKAYVIFDNSDKIKDKKGSLRVEMFIKNKIEHNIFCLLFAHESLIMFDGQYEWHADSDLPNYEMVASYFHNTEILYPKFHVKSLLFVRAEGVGVDWICFDGYDFSKLRNFQERILNRVTSILQNEYPTFESFPENFKKAVMTEFRDWTTKSNISKLQSVFHYIHQMDYLIWLNSKEQDRERVERDLVEKSHNIIMKYYAKELFLEQIRLSVEAKLDSDEIFYASLAFSGFDGFLEK